MASDCSFDVVSKVDMDEVKNAITQAMKEIGQRFDFKGSISKIDLKEEGVLILTSDDDVRLKAVIDVLQSKLVKRGVSIRSMEFGKVEPASKGSAPLATISAATARRARGERSSWLAFMSRPRWAANSASTRSAAVLKVAATEAISSCPSTIARRPNSPAPQASTLPLSDSSRRVMRAITG